MKYIDAEKLIAEIERHIKHYESSNRDDFKNGELYICYELLSIIDSLRQEQKNPNFYMEEDWIKCQIAELEKLLEVNEGSEIMRISLQFRIDEFKKELNHFNP